MQPEEKIQSQDAKSIIEALLFVSEDPLSLKHIQKILEPYPQQEVEKILLDLQEEYNKPGHGLQLVKVAGGYQITTRSNMSGWIKKLFKEKEGRGLSGPALETLAIIAYKQPITRAEIETVRGVDVSGILSSLLAKSLIRITGRRDVPGKPLIYGTTDDFLLYFGLEDLNSLPKLGELEKPDSIQ